MVRIKEDMEGGELGHEAQVALPGLGDHRGGRITFFHFEMNIGRRLKFSPDMKDGVKGSFEVVPRSVDCHRHRAQPPGDQQHHRQHCQHD